MLLFDFFALSVLSVIMLALPRFLCTSLKCDMDALPDAIRADPKKVLKLLEGLPLYHSVPGSGGELTPV